ncbi:MAG: adenylate/guanylate cyclase domain-containing protein, partial [Cyanobacteria bacterium]|nr:adenylate/guanylate cyclase domain-containing protein [Cyanobacteriota bacterium]MDW8203319.1 adenylate/guanylate cyclase domain-containing protein [Cyanobacteriota bacterium SKYGB_h_bin112]
LLNILPAPIVEELKHRQTEHNTNHMVLAQRFDEVTILFADIVNFTQWASQVSPIELVNVLNAIFSRFDQLADQHGLEKIKTIGDAYMVVGGLPTPRPDHAVAVANMALDMLQVIREFHQDKCEPFCLRIGINTGTAVAGVIGIRKFTYDLWGDAVNLASRMESQGVVDAIQVTETTYERLRDRYQFEPRGTVKIKGKGEMQTYLLRGKLTNRSCLQRDQTAVN